MLGVNDQDLLLLYLAFVWCRAMSNGLMLTHVNIPHSLQLCYHAHRIINKWFFCLDLLFHHVSFHCVDLNINFGPEFS